MAPEKIRPPMRGRMQGLTLIELAVVLVVLIALASMLMPASHETSRIAQCVATDASLATLREAIMGSGSQLGYLSDMGAYPRHPVPTPTANPFDLHYLFEDWSANYELAENTCLSIGPSDPACVHLARFNPVTQRGWRGPYLQANGSRCENLDRAVMESTVQPDERTALVKFLTNPVCSFMGTSDGVVSLCARSPLYTQCKLQGSSLLGSTVNKELRVALDSFNVMGLGKGLAVRSPILLMKDRQHHHYLVSAGSDGVTYLTDPNLSAKGEVDPDPKFRRDDRVLYLDGFDRWGNQPCSR